MIFRSLQLRNWGVFKEETNLGFEPGFNIIIGPNETGKSTIWQAFLRAFFIKHNVSSAAQAFVPWGTYNLSPEITVVFETSGKTYRVFKRFMKGHDAELFTLDGDKWSSIATADEADKLTASFFDGSLPTRITKFDKWRTNWGIVQSLWSPQGTLGSGWDPGDAARSRLLTEVGGVITTNSENLLIDKLTRELDKRLTKGKRDIKKGSDLWIIEDNIAKTTDFIEEISIVARTREEKARSLEGIEDTLSVHEHAYAEAREELIIAQTAAEEARKHHDVRKEKNVEVKTLERDWKEINDCTIRIQKDEKELQTLMEEEKQGNDIKEIEQDIEVERKDLGDIELKRDTMDEEINKIEAKLKNSRIAYDIIIKRIELANTKQTLNRVEGLEEERNNILHGLKISKEVKEKDIKKIMKDSRDLERLQGKMEAQGLTVNITSRTKMNGKVELDNNMEPLSLKKNETIKWKASQKLKFLIPKVVDIEIKSGSEDVKKMKQQSIKIQKKIKKSLVKFGVKDLESLRSRQYETKQMKKRISQLDKDIVGTTSDGIVSEKKKIVKITADIDSAKLELSEDSEQMKIAFSDRYKKRLPEASKAIKKAEESQRKLRKESHVHKAKEKKVQGTYQRLNKKLADLKNKMAQRETALKFLQKNLKDARKDGFSDKERIKLKDKKAADLAIAHSSLAGLESEIEEKENRPIIRLETAEKTIKGHQEEIELLSTKAAELRGAIEQLVSKGDYSEYIKLDEQLTELNRKKKKLRLETDSISILVDLLNHSQRQFVKAVANPVQKIVEENFRRLVGPRYSGIEFDENLIVNAVKLEDADESPPLESLSHGTREQLGMLVRLAMAEVMVKEESLPIILDDPLAHTDSIRRRHALEILQEAAEKLQVIVLTCHPEHYVGLTEANRIELE